MSAGTGGTSATIGRYIRYKGLSSQLVVVDPEFSVFFDSFKTTIIHLLLPVVAA